MPFLRLARVRYQSNALPSARMMLAADAVDPAALE
jgi:hypothetical protein